MTLIENGQPVCLPERKEEVRDLLLTAARKKKVIKYPQMYSIFEEEKEQDVSFLTWRNSVWITVEEVCNEISTPEGAIYYSLLSNKNNVPENEFIRIVYRYRNKEYQERFNVSLPQFEDFDDEFKLKLIQFERSRVYRHVEIHHGL
ncbi:hypothetical protein [Methylophaga sp.]|jgi:hypothetical protein|uniref:hypothetical protein n=1 Tax=Methylophaga sp. TaxID=2024840 RepID=UPI003F70962F|tara:strand:+ start:493 stop:930 length:438 start_codon:yes stop_codon:yes gene_type:complete